MKITFYNTVDLPNVVNKTLTKIGDDINIVFLDYADIVNPILRLKTIPENANYCFIDSLDRYYFFNSQKILHNGLFEIQLKCDVLYTYKTEIENANAEIVESENVLNENKTDYVNENTETINEINITSPFTTFSDVLITVQGA